MVLYSFIFVEIVLERVRISIYVLDRLFELILVLFVFFIVGMFVQNVYGYKLILEGFLSVMKIEIDRENVVLLVKVLYLVIGIFMVICCMIYLFLYCMYFRDRDRVKMQVLIELEMLQFNEEEEDDKFGIEVKYFGDEEYDEIYLLKQEQSESVR